jgi:hypothetical protein
MNSISIRIIPVPQTGIDDQLIFRVAESIPSSPSKHAVNARVFLMFRINPIAIALLCTVAACSPAPESSERGAPDFATQTVQTANQDALRPQITSEKIVHDITGGVIKITAVEGDSPPTDWTFDAGEFKQVEILDREATPAGATITVFMMTRNNAAPDEDAVMVSGKLRLHYLRKAEEWVLMKIENLTFRYTTGTAI